MEEKLEIVKEGRCLSCGEVKSLSGFSIEQRKDESFYACLACLSQRNYLKERDRELEENIEKFRVEAERLFSIGLKKCPNCNLVKMLHEFAANSKRRSGKQSICRSCYSVYARNRRASDLTTARQKERAKKYGISVEEYRSLVDRGKCDCCGSEDPSSVYGWSIDHDHNCHEKNRGCRKCIRGMLCNLCNTAFGMVREDTNRIKALLDYAERLSVGDYPARNFIESL